MSITAKSFNHAGLDGLLMMGWGMYFASAREVADGYRISLSSQAGHAPSIRGRSVISYYDAAEREGSRGGPLGYDKAALLERLMLHDSPQQVIAHGRDPDSGISPEAVAWFEREVAPHFKAGGQLYQAEIPEDSDLLDWDKPLSEQPEKLREALAQAREFAEAAEQLGGISIRRVDDGVLAGAGLYGAIERAAGSPKAASEYLNSIGIPGLRYLDGNSRASGEGSANYVIWDEALLTPEAARIEAVYNQGPRAAFNPERLAITLLGGADLSSFLHESGHFFFENDIALASEIVAAQRQGASITPGEQQMLADVGQLLTWHGLKGDVAAQLTEWHNMPFEEKRALHERTAESFEAYLFEGSIATGEQHRNQIILHAREHNLHLGIAEAAVELDNHRAVARDHEPRIQHAHIRSSGIRHPLHTRLQNGIENLRGKGMEKDISCFTVNWSL